MREVWNPVTCHLFSNAGDFRHEVLLSRCLSSLCLAYDLVFTAAYFLAYFVVDGLSPFYALTKCPARPLTDGCSDKSRETPAASPWSLQPEIQSSLVRYRGGKVSAWHRNVQTISNSLEILCQNHACAIRYPITVHVCHENQDMQSYGNVW